MLGGGLEVGGVVGGVLGGVGREEDVVGGGGGEDEDDVEAVDELGVGVGREDEVVGTDVVGATECVVTSVVFISWCVAIDNFGFPAR